MDAFVVSLPTSGGDLLFLTNGGTEWTRDPQVASLYVNRWLAEVDAAGVHGRVITQRLALQLRAGVDDAEVPVNA